MSDDPRTERPHSDEQRRGEQNEIGYRNIDEEGEHHERGSQSPGRGEPPADEEIG